MVINNNYYTAAGFGYFNQPEYRIQPINRPPVDPVPNDLIIPKGYSKITDLNYIIQGTDKYYLRPNGMFMDIAYFFEICIGKTVGEVTEEQIKEFNREILLITRQPRFKTDKPYPYGY